MHLEHCATVPCRCPLSAKAEGGQRFVLSSFVSCYGEQNACVPRLVGPEVGQRPFVKKQLLLSGVFPSNYAALRHSDFEETQNY